ncbi:MAG: hypothetical protein WC523_04425 [Patescibacteria group bacterium]
MKNGRYVYGDGTIRYYLNDQFHRTDGPAIEYADGTKSWWINGQRHREDGPAIKRADGSKAWYLKGVECTEEEFKAYKLIKQLAGLK